MAYEARREEFGRISAEWMGLLDQAAFQCVFYRPSWQQTWSEVFREGREPEVFTVRDGERLLAVAPLIRDGTALCLAGDSEICDYMDVVLAGGAEDRACATLLDALVAEPWDELVLWGLPEHSPTLRVLPDLARARGLSVAVEPEAVCPRVELPADGQWDTYLAGLTKKDRHELRRKLRRLQHAGDIEFYSLTDPADVAAGMDDFFHLHRVSRRDKAEFMSPEMERFFRRLTEALAAEGLIRLFFLNLDGRRVASVLTFDCGDEISLYNSGFDPEYAHLSVGLLSKALCVQAAVDAGKRYLDFLRGHEPYKYDLGGKDLQVYRCVLRRS